MYDAAECVKGRKTINGQNMRRKAEHTQTKLLHQIFASCSQFKLKLSLHHFAKINRETNKMSNNNKNKRNKKKKQLKLS